MREPTVAKNYAQALFELGEERGETVRYAELMEALGDVIRTEERVRAVLDSPRVTKTQKIAILESALEDIAPPGLTRFLGAVVRRNRQGILPAIADQLIALVDHKMGRVHALVTLAREPGKSLRDAVQKRLGQVLDGEIIPHFRADPAILGGVIVRVGDRIHDGSLRRRMVVLRRQMLGT